MKSEENNIAIGAGLGSWIHKENPTKDKKE